MAATVLWQLLVFRFASLCQAPCQKCLSQLYSIDIHQQPPFGLSTAFPGTKVDILPRPFWCGLGSRVGQEQMCNDSICRTHDLIRENGEERVGQRSPSIKKQKSCLYMAGLKCHCPSEYDSDLSGHPYLQIPQFSHPPDRLVCYMRKGIMTGESCGRN